MAVPNITITTPEEAKTNVYINQLVYVYFDKYNISKDTILLYYTEKWNWNYVNLILEV